MGRVGWLGIALLCLSVATITRGINVGHEPHDGLVALSRPDVVQALLESLGLAALPFGLTFLISGGVATKPGEGEPMFPKSWTRAVVLFFAVWAIVALVFLGPTLIAQTLGKDWRWADRISDNLCPMIIGAGVLVQHGSALHRWAAQFWQKGAA